MKKIFLLVAILVTFSLADKLDEQLACSLTKLTVQSIERGFSASLKEADYSIKAREIGKEAA